MKGSSPEDIARWDRWFAVESNNLAWEIIENPARTELQKEAMLHAAHTSAFHWGRVGSELHKVRADMLLGMAHALLGNGSMSTAYASRCHEYFTSHETADWEIAFSHAVSAHAAFAAKDIAAHAKHYAQAKRLGEAIDDPREREVFQRTFAQVPVPAPPWT